MPKGEFIVMKTGVHPMKVHLKLFFKWGIEFDEEHPYVVPENGNRRVQYAEKKEIQQGIMEKYHPESIFDAPPVSEKANNGGNPHGDEQKNIFDEVKPLNEKERRKKRGGTSAERTGEYRWVALIFSISQIYRIVLYLCTFILMIVPTRTASAGRLSRLLPRNSSSHNPLFVEPCVISERRSSSKPNSVTARMMQKAVCYINLSDRMKEADDKCHPLPFTFCLPPASLFSQVPSLQTYPCILFSIVYTAYSKPLCRGLHSRRSFCFP